MTEVIIERHPGQPLTPADAAAIIEGGDDCRAIHRLIWHRSLLSTDGRQMVCHLTSPDLESARIALRNAAQRMPMDIWSCTVRDMPELTPAELERGNVAARFRFEAPLTDEQLQSIEACGGVCRTNHRVRILRTFVASDRRRVICLCLAADAESVRIALRDVQPPVERVWALRQFHGSSVHE